MDRLSDLLFTQFQELRVSTSDTARMKLKVRSVTDEADGVLSFTLIDPHGGLLPAYEAGAHIDVHIAPHVVRQYSIAGDPAERDRYVIAVLKEPAGRGGSQAIHETFRPGRAGRPVSWPPFATRCANGPPKMSILSTSRRPPVPAKRALTAPSGSS